MAFYIITIDMFHAFVVVAGEWTEFECVYVYIPATTSAICLSCVSIIAHIIHSAHLLTALSRRPNKTRLTKQL